MAVRLVLALLTALWAATPGFAQGPIPPVQVPEEFREPIDGYSMITPYQLWRMWIEREKGPVTEQALAQPDVLEGRQRVGRPLVTAAFNNDFGRYATADVQVYCTVMPVYPDRNRGECSYLFRWAEVPIHVSYRDTTNAMDVWMRTHFDPERIVRNLRAADVAPDGDLWRVSREAMFEGTASPRPMLAGHLRIGRVDSRECPAFRAAVEAVEGARPDWTLDLFAVGSDLPFRVPGPHARTATYTLNTLVDGQWLTLTGDGALGVLVGPMVRAAYSCDQARQASRS